MYFWKILPKQVLFQEMSDVNFCSSFLSIKPFRKVKYLNVRSKKNHRWVVREHPKVQISQVEEKVLVAHREGIQKSGFSEIERRRISETG